jgi:O-antigen/teichoic acid export membrane protein
MSGEKSKKNTVFFLILISAVGYILNILFHNYLTHRLPPDLYGDLAIALNVLEITATLLLFGTEISAMRYIPMLQKICQEDTFIHWNFYIVKKISLYFFLFLFLSLLLLFVFHLDEKLINLHTAYFILFAAPFSGVFGLYIADLTSKNNVLTAALIGSIVRYLLIWFFFIFTLEVAGLRIDNLMIALIYIFSFFLLSALAIYFYNRFNKPISFKQLIGARKVHHKDVTIWKKSSLKNFLANLVFLLFIYVDKIILEIVHSSEDIVGYYSIIVMLAGLFSLIAQSASQVLAPYISSMTYEKEKSQLLQRVVNTSNGVVFVLSVVLFVSYFLFGKEILSLFGKNGHYAIVYTAFIYLCISQLFLELGRLSLRFLLYNDMTEYINKVISLSLILLVAGGVILTNYFGLYGLIAAHIVTSFFYMSAFFLKAKKEFGYVKIYTFF